MKHEIKTPMKYELFYGSPLGPKSQRDILEQKCILTKS